MIIARSCKIYKPVKELIFSSDFELVIKKVEKLNQKAEATVHLSGAEVSSRGHRAAGCSEGDESLSSPQIESLS